MTKPIFITFSIILIFINSNCQKDIVDIPPDIDTTQPGRRDYVWTVDTLILPYGDAFTPTRIWGSSPNDVWITGFGDAGDLLWHFDGTRWTRDETRYLISPSALWGTDSNNIWLGSVSGTFWRFDGTKWYKYSEHSLDDYQQIVIESIYGSTSNNLYACGTASRSITEKPYRGILMHFDGIKWAFVNIPDIKISFTRIIVQKKTGLIFLEGDRYESSGDTSKIYIYDGQTTREIYSNAYYNATINEIDGEIYIIYQKQIFKYLNGSMRLWKDLTNSDFVGTLYGRNEKDFFSLSKYGIGHYNGTNFQTIYSLTQDRGVSGTFVFSNEIFFQSYSNTEVNNIVLHGK